MKKLALFLIIGTEFCERFCYYGLRALIFPFLHNNLGLSIHIAKGISHAFFFLSFLFAVIFGFLSDIMFGHYYTIVSLSLVYLIGTFLLIISAYFNNSLLFIIAIFTVAMGTGGIKPCISIFGGDQFRNSNFFSLFYFAINCGAMISILTLPILSKTSYTIAFSLPFILVACAIILFLSGSKFYLIKKPDPDLKYQFFKFFKNKKREHQVIDDNQSFFYDEFDESVGIKKFTEFDSTKREERLNNNGNYNNIFVNELPENSKNEFVNLEPTSEPLILENKESSSITECDQQTEKNENIINLKSQNKINFDEIDHQSTEYQIINNNYSTKSKNNINFDEIKKKSTEYQIINNNYPTKSENNTSFDSQIENEVNEANKKNEIISLECENELPVTEYDIDKEKIFKNDMKNILKILFLYLPITFFWTIYDQQATSWTEQASSLNLKIFNFTILPSQMQVLNALLTLIFIPLFSNLKISHKRKMVIGFYLGACSFFASALVEHFKDENTTILIQIPQYFLLTAGEVLLSVTGLEFSYNMAPHKFKSTILSIWLFMASIGNVLVAIISKFELFKAPIGEYLFWGFLAFLGSRILNYKFSKMKN